MVRCSNSLVGILNIITLLISIPIIGSGIWLSKQGNTECERFLDKPVIALGVFVLLVSIAGLIGSCCRVSWLLWVYLLVMFLLIVLLFCFTIFAFVVTNRYNCGSCKAGLLDNIKSDWKRVAVINIVFLVFLIIVYSIGCCAFRNNREDNSWKRYP